MYFLIIFDNLKSLTSYISRLTLFITYNIFFLQIRDK